MVKKIIHWVCEICNEEYLNEDDAVECESKGVAPLYPIGMIFRMGYEGIVFAVIKQYLNQWKHHHSYATWACRDIGVGDNCGGDDYCGLESWDYICPPDKSLPAYKRMVEALRIAGITPSDYETKE